MDFREEDSPPLAWKEILIIRLYCNLFRLLPGAVLKRIWSWNLFHAAINMQVQERQDTITDKNVKYEEEFITRRGLKLFTCRWLPADQDMKALVFLCHGYGAETSVFMKGKISIYPAFRVLPGE